MFFAERNSLAAAGSHLLLLKFETGDKVTLLMIPFQPHPSNMYSRVVDFLIWQPSYPQ